MTRSLSRRTLLATAAASPLASVDTMAGRAWRADPACAAVSRCFVLIEERDGLDRDYAHTEAALAVRTAPLPLIQALRSAHPLARRLSVLDRKRTRCSHALEAARERAAAAAATSTLGVRAKLDLALRLAAPRDFRNRHNGPWALVQTAALDLTALSINAQ